MVSHHENQYHHHREGDAHRIAGELLNGHHGQARHELTNEFTHNPREAQRLLHQIGGELRKHGYRGIGVELDHHHNVTGVDFNHHNIYSSHFHPEHHQYGGHHNRQHHHGEASHAYGQGHHHHEGHHGGRHHHHHQEESFAPPHHERQEQRRQADKDEPRTMPNPFKEIGHAIGDVARKVGDGIDHAATEIGHELQGISHAISEKMAHLSVQIANRLGTTGDCAHGPRLVFNQMGLHLPPVMATEQGRLIRKSGMFDEIPESQVRPGDYGVRNWSNHVIRQHGYNAGDSFIVASNHRGNIVQANDHIQNIDRRGRYSDVHYYRPNAKFIAMMQEKGLI